MSGIPYKPLVYTPIQYKPIQHEFSFMRSQRDSHSPLKVWRDTSAYARQINNITQNVQGINRQFNKVRSPVQLQFDFYPFRIYSIPQIFRGPNNADNWRTFKVRNGEVLTDIVANVSSSFTGSPTWVFGTDGVPYPDSNVLPSPITVGDIMAPESASRFYFWIETLNPALANTGSNIIQYGTDPRTVGIQHTWDTFPSSSANHIIIGYVDTATAGSSHTAFIRNYVRADITSNVSFFTASLCLNNQEVVYYLAGHPSGSGG